LLPHLVFFLQLVAPICTELRVMPSFDGKVIIITGSSTGIGRHAAVAFAKAGASIVMHGQSEERLRQTEELVTNSGISKEKSLCIVGSMEDENTPKKIIDATIAKFGRIDVLINNAGAVMKPSTDIYDLENFDYLIKVNLRSVIALTQLAVPYLAKTHGNVVNVSSVVSTRVLPQAPFYAMTKSALDHFTRHAAGQYGADGIRVNSLNPGPVETHIWNRHYTTPEAQETLNEWAVESTILRRAGRCEEMTPVLLFLASDDASYVTGANWLADGGYAINTKSFDLNPSS
jgi:NAD(P)-dependent dehydrogenase (short-subunit alcohol dehydrogenase family)